jgi:hypothetical protein
MKRKKGLRTEKSKKQVLKPKKADLKPSRKKLWLVIFACIFLSLAFVLSCVIIRSPAKLKASDFSVSYAQSVPFDQQGIVLDNFLDILNSVPDKKARDSLLGALRSKKIPIRFSDVRADIIFENYVPDFAVNYELIQPGILPKEVLWSTLIHENVHLEGYLSGRVPVRKLSDCRRLNIVKKCAFEYFLDEHAGLKKQFEFLESRNSSYLNVPQIRAAYFAGDSKRSALSLFRRNYIESGFVNPDYRPYYDEFERLMLSDESLVYNVIQD